VVDSCFRAILAGISYVTADLYRAAISNLLVANHREPSLVDCCSFEYMRRNRVLPPFAYDKHLNKQGLDCCDE